MWINEEVEAEMFSSIELKEYDWGVLITKDVKDLIIEYSNKVKEVLRGIPYKIIKTVASEKCEKKTIEIGGEEFEVYECDKIGVFRRGEKARFDKIYLRLLNICRECKPEKIKNAIENKCLSVIAVLSDTLAVDLLNNKVIYFEHKYAREKAGLYDEGVYLACAFVRLFVKTKRGTYKEIEIPIGEWRNRTIGKDGKSFLKVVDKIAKLEGRSDVVCGVIKVEIRKEGDKYVLTKFEIDESYLKQLELIRKSACEELKRVRSAFDVRVKIELDGISEAAEMLKKVEAIRKEYSTKLISIANEILKTRVKDCPLENCTVSRELITDKYEKAKKYFDYLCSVGIVKPKNERVLEINFVKQLTTGFEECLI